jgi:hypothetical protein
MVQWSDNQNPGANRPEFDRTVIRPSHKGPPAASSAGNRSEKPATSTEKAAAPKRSPVILYAALAIGFLVLGGAAGGIAHLISTGAISLSPPEEAGPQQAADTLARSSETENAPPQDPEETGGTDQPLEQEGENAALTNEEDLDVPADPFFDMALSAVIPLAGDPVLLKDGAANRRIDLSERPVPAAAIGDGSASVPSAAAYILDSQMLDDDGNLVIRAPGSEADFQFGNFGGGDEAEGIVVEEDARPADDSSTDLPVFLKPSTDTLNLYLTERPIGQGRSRIEVREEVEKPGSLKDFLKGKGFDEEVLEPLVKFVRDRFDKSDLIAGDKIAIRGVRVPNKLGRIGDYYRPVQLSIYTREGYLGTAAYSVGRDGDGYVAGADPWFGKTIVAEKPSGEEAKQSASTHRLIDGLYATAVRNAVPASIVGEAIAYLAPMTDLKRAIKPDERVTLVFTDTARDEKRGGGRVLFAGVRRGDDWSVRCYVLKAPGNRGFACVNEGGKVSLSGAMLVPVKGVLTSKFGLRFHPIKKTERLHAGVDWAAPTGTAIHAAFSGKVTYRDVRGGYGNFIELTHKGGITSRYAHMHEFADGIQLGSVVQAGDLIGYVGTTGLSTGPHLHFEIRHNGEPTDPLAFEMETGADSPQSVGSKDLKDYRTVIADILSVQ